MGEPHPMVEDMAKRTAKASRNALETVGVRSDPHQHTVRMKETQTRRGVTQYHQAYIPRTESSNPTLVHSRTSNKTSKWGGSTDPSKHAEIVAHAKEEVKKRGL